MKRYIPVLKAFTLALIFSVAVALFATNAALQFGAEQASASAILAITFATVFSAAFVIPTINLFRGKATYGKGIFAAGLYPEVYTREIIKRFNTLDQAGWRQGIPNKSQYTSMTADGESVVINMTYFGVSPDVLIDNNSYPIDVQTLDGENVVMSLKKFQTKATPVTDDEIRGLSYDKIKTVQEVHVIVIDETKNNLAIHSIAPNNNNNAKAPVLVTTGADCGDGTGRLKLTRADIILLKRKFDDALIPVAGRRLVLCPAHVQDLLLEDQKFADQYYNYVTGKIANLYGFEVYEYPAMPYYNFSTKAKLAFGGTVTTSHNMASVAFSLQRVAQANGFTKAYISESKNDPLNQRNLINYRHYDVVLPTKVEGQGAIVSGKAA